MTNIPQTIKKSYEVTSGAEVKTGSMGNRKGVRCSGRTTALVLEAIAASYGSPYIPVLVMDHEGGSTHFLLSSLRITIKALGLKGFSVTIVCDPVAGITSAVKVVYDPIIEVTYVLQE